MMNFDCLNDLKDWRNFVYKIKIRLNQIENPSEYLEMSLHNNFGFRDTETPRYVDRPMLRPSISTHPAQQRTEEKDCHGTFTFLHMLIISKNMKVLRYIFIIHKEINTVQTINDV